MANEEAEELRTDMVNKPVQLEEEFLRDLYLFMKKRDTPIERIPNLGFKQIDLFIMFKTVQSLGGYKEVTTQQLWKQVYNRLGGNPRSTSAATCTRRHYEKLILPYERHLRGQESETLPLPLPQKRWHAEDTERKVETECKMAKYDMPLYQKLPDFTLDHSAHPIQFSQYHHSKSSPSAFRTPAPLNYPVRRVFHPIVSSGDLRKVELQYPLKEFHSSQEKVEPLNLSLKNRISGTMCKDDQQSAVTPASNKAPKFLNKVSPLYVSASLKRPIVREFGKTRLSCTSPKVFDLRSLPSASTETEQSCSPSKSMSLYKEEHRNYSHGKSHTSSSDPVNLCSHPPAKTEKTSKDIIVPVPVHISHHWIDDVKKKSISMYPNRGDIDQESLHKHIGLHSVSPGENVEQWIFADGVHAKDVIRRPTKESSTKETMYPVRNTIFPSSFTQVCRKFIPVSFTNNSLEKFALETPQSKDCSQTLRKYEAQDGTCSQFSLVKTVNSLSDKRFPEQSPALDNKMTNQVYPRGYQSVKYYMKSDPALRPHTDSRSSFYNSHDLPWGSIDQYHRSDTSFYTSDAGRQAV
ncbi:AT-rich interaction domain 6 [Polypterus senegalus]|uniref:AT-rich interaction domain 6 n=1 Tax=Polypterus senegalus TaxID=55291 RepID=UPI0019636B4F|nr:AT-rich interaction domain 6 [Polypterus senegalus]